MGSHKLAVTAKPLKIDFYSNGVLVVSANARGLLKFEQYRQKKEKVEGEQVTLTEINWDQSLKFYFEGYGENLQTLSATSYTLLIHFLQTPCKLLANFLRTPKELLTDFLQMSYKLLTNVLQTSYKSLMNFIQISYELI